MKSLNFDFPANLILTWGVDIFFGKEGAEEKGGMEFEIEDWGTSTHFCWHWTKLNAELVYFFWVFDDQKKNSFFNKVLLTCVIIPWLLSSFDSPRYGSESRKKIHNKSAVGVLRVGARKGRVLEAVLPGMGANDLLQGKLGLWGLELGGNYSCYYSTAFFPKHVDVFWEENSAVAIFHCCITAKDNAFSK